jgi:hypothetical protein
MVWGCKKDETSTLATQSGQFTTISRVIIRLGAKNRLPACSLATHLTMKRAFLDSRRGSNIEHFFTAFSPLAQNASRKSILE